MGPDEYIERKKDGTVKLVKLLATGQVFYTAKNFDSKSGKELSPSNGQIDRQNIINQQTNYENQITSLQNSITNCKTFIKDIDTLVPVGEESVK